MNRKLVFILIVLAILYIMEKKNLPTEEKSYIKERDALKKIADQYGREIAQNVEKIFRLETANFSSGGYKRTNGAGMEAIKKDYPFGWSSKVTDGVNMRSDTIRMIDSGGRDVRFIHFETVYDGMKAVANYLKHYSPERWYSTDPKLQAVYREKLNKIKTTLV